MSTKDQHCSLHHRFYGSHVLTSVRPSIRTDIPQAHDIFGLQALDKVEKSGTFDLSDREEDDSDSCRRDRRQLVEHTDNIDAPGTIDLAVLLGGLVHWYPKYSMAVFSRDEGE